MARDTYGAVDALSDPVSPLHRVEVIDALRGFALFGVVAANMLSQSGFNMSRPVESPVDRAVFWIMMLFIAGKFIALFSMLFGVGFGIQLARATSRGTAFVRRYGRRLAGLFLIGVLHHVFFLTGDILKDYAVLGAILLLFRNASDRSLLIAAALAVFLPSASEYVIDALAIPQPARADPAVTARILAEGTYFERVGMHLDSLPGKWRVFATSNTYYLAMFLLGFYAARKELWRADGERPNHLRRIFWLALILAVAGRVLSPLLEPWIGRLPDVWRSPVTGLLGSFRTLALSVAYGAGFVLLWHSSGRVRRWLSPLCDVGRLALTNYVTVSVVGTILFFSLRLRGTMGVTAAVGLGVLLFVLQILWSRWWLLYFRYGPLEWFWRSLAYGRRQRMRRDEIEPAPITA